MKDTIRFRMFVQGDESQLIEMNTELFSGDTATLGVLPVRHVQNTIESFFSGNNLVDIYIFDQESETIGYAIVSWFWSNEFGGRSILLDEILVKEEFRGKGIGSRFIGFAMDKYKDAAVFMLEVSPGNPKARRLYETIGFKELKTRHLFLVRKKFTD
jgi:GNAT superfamily N-acetyltransferase